MMMILVDLVVFLVSLRWPRSGDMWSRIFPLPDAVVSKFLYRFHKEQKV
jgi:hypothetical protein